MQSAILTIWVARLQNMSASGTGRLEKLASFLLDPTRTDPPQMEAPTLPELSPEPSASVQSSAGSNKRKLDRAEGLAAGCLISGQQATHNAWRWKVEQCDRTLLDIPKLHEVMRGLNQSVGDRFDLRLPKAKLASAVLQHCVAVVAGVSAQGARFKIGITSDPGFRWFNEGYGYARQGTYVCMHIIAIVKTMEAAAYLEAALIREFRSYVLCDNEASGGEGAAWDTSPGFVYVVRSEYSNI